MNEPKKPGRSPRGGAGGRSGRPTSGKPSGGKAAGNGRGGSGRTSGKPTTSGGRPQRSGAASGRPQRSAGPGQVDRSRPAERTAEQKVYDGPPIPDDVRPSDLDKFARRELQGIPEKLADKVACHLVMAGSLLHENPQLAHDHALAARARAMRTGLVREAVGETAYACGRWAEALAEFRAARRMTGRLLYVPMMADCERALKRPEKALAYDTADIRSKLDDAANAELTIVMAGARRDLGQVEAALQLLEAENLMSRQRSEWLPRLRYAYADALLAAGRRDEAITWFHRTVAVDGDAATDAQERLDELDPGNPDR